MKKKGQGLLSDCNADLTKSLPVNWGALEQRLPIRKVLLWAEEALPQSLPGH